MNRFSYSITRVSELAGLVSAWLLFATGVFLTWEVFTRYVLRAPTKWASELSELFLMWGVFLALGYTIRHAENIVIDIVYLALPKAMQRMLDIFALLFVAAFSVIVFWYGLLIAWDSVEHGSTTATILDYPKWWAEAAIPVGFGLGILQCAVEVCRVILGGRDEGSRGGHFSA
ncbi:MAG: TRAP transporter small permease [Pseudomonadota bacterium]|nr:TRAP transporter small permease [Pseudomonadota bacterium]